MNNNDYISFNIEKIKDKGEDADPIYLKGNNGEIFISVFDGLGGAGARKIKFNGREETSARVASREIRNLVENYFKEDESRFRKEAEDIKEELENKIKEKIKKLIEEFPNESKIRSKIVKEFPTTFAGILSRPKDSIYEVVSFWAGDSRNFILEIEKNEKRRHRAIPRLYQISKDHFNGESDPFKIQDSPMNNCISENDFNIEYLTIYPAKESLLGLISATDGVFAYLESPQPASLEELLLKTIKNTKDETGFKKQFRKEIEKVAQDDASFVFAFINTINTGKIFNKSLIYDNSLGKDVIVAKMNFDKKLEELKKQYLRYLQ